MKEKILLEKTIKYLNRLLQAKPLKSIKEIQEVKKIREELNALLYGKKEIRSKNANSYLWILCTKIGNVLKKSKEEVYLDMLKSYGQVMMIPVLKGTTPYGYFKYYEYETTSVLNGKEADWYKVYKGSSNFTKHEMYILLEGIKQECHNLDIPTISDKEFESLIGSWNNE